MRIAAIPDNLLERVAMWIGIVPTPVLETFHAAAVARAIMVATKLGVFETLTSGGQSAAKIARQVNGNATAIERLLNVLVTARYLKYQGSHYHLARRSRRWLLRDSRGSLHDNILFRFLEWEAIERLEEYVRSGKHLDVHDQIQGPQWEIYQRGMRSIAGLSAAEVARRLPVPASATSLLDIGGSHGFHSVAICRRYPRLRATVLDLPAAVEHARPILAEEKMGDRVTHRIGDALTEDLGEAAWDVVFISHLIHHFDEAANRALVSRAASALKRTGVLAVLDAPRVPAAGNAGQTAALLDLYFAMTSNSGCWTETEIKAWMKSSGLDTWPAIPLRSAPGLAVFVGKKN